MNRTPGIGVRLEHLRSGELAPSAFVLACADAIHATEHDVRAWASLGIEGALAEVAAAESDPGSTLRPLGGLPIGIKDLIDVAGFETRGGSRHFARRPQRDARCVQQLRDAGAIVLGKTTTHEFAFGGTTPPTRNPRNLDHIAGGSSGGSAAAVAAGHCGFALGSDTAGSIRIPSSYCGVTGLKPTAGAISNDGLIPLASSLDTVGPIVGLAADLALVWPTMIEVGASTRSGGPPPDDLSDLRVGLPRAYFFENLQPGVSTAIDAAIAHVVDLGATITEVDIPHASLASAAAMAIMLGESGEYHRDRILRVPELFSPDVRNLLQAAQLIPAVDYVRAQRVRQLINAEVAGALTHVDVLCLPTLPCTAPTVVQGEAGTITLAGKDVPLGEAQIRNVVPFNFAGVPAVTQPCGLDGAGLPVGLQWVAASFAEELLIRIAIKFESTYPWHDKEFSANPG